MATSAPCYVALCRLAWRGFVLLVRHAALVVLRCGGTGKFQNSRGKIQCVGQRHGRRSRVRACGVAALCGGATGAGPRGASGHERVVE